MFSSSSVRPFSDTTILVWCCKFDSCYLSRLLVTLGLSGALQVGEFQTLRTIQFTQKTNCKDMSCGHHSLFFEGLPHICILIQSVGEVPTDRQSLESLKIFLGYGALWAFFSSGLTAKMVVITKSLKNFNIGCIITANVHISPCSNKLVVT
jgi:hypothetical protein